MCFVTKFKSLFPLLSSRIMMLPWILLLLLAHDDCLGELTLGETSDVESLVTEGKLQYELIKSNAKLPQYGKCWLSALEFLHNGCGSLTDEIQSRIALKFANCFLEKAGLNTYACPEEEPIRECLRNVDHNAFTSYNGFFMQARSMCYFVMSQIWHKTTERRIQGLGEASSKAISSLESFSKEMQEVQSKNLEFQRSMMENGTALSHALEASRTNVRDMLSEFRSSTDEQRSMIFEIFDRVSQLQNLVLSEVSWIYAVVFYGGSLLFVYVLTATKRTAEARLWMLLIISINFGIERAVTSGSLPANGDFVAQIRDDLSTRLYERVWNVRKVCSLLCLLTLFYFALKFKDYNKINNKLLEDIQKQNLELRQLMESHRLDLTQSSSETKLPSLQSHEFSSCHTRDCFDDEEDQEDNADTSSLDSFTSFATDRTFNASKAIDFSDSDTACEDEVLESGDENLSIFEGSLFLDESKTIDDSHSYNLRSRKRLNWNKKDWDNPILDAESPNSFAKLVNKMATMHKARSENLIKRLGNRDNYKDKFSSDDE
eukprot:TRINITY_DN4448_c0_g1_i1.p1 TRINITY_DN4448_c0_g1~~TRINITY_DN4448_c0_g1_i1.p1  ORF type:complete len:545 (+),score=157.85 TRINITY_DN4448_c0_g1_i1:174-1808(+)